MKPNQTQFNVIQALRLRGMQVLSQQSNVIHIDRPSSDFRKAAVDIIENIKGIRRRSQAVQFHGVTVRWSEDA